MPTIRLTTYIKARPEIVFDLSRNIDVHQQSLKGTSEKAVAGTTTGFIWLGETVTWKARHLLKTRRFTSKITALSPYDYFEDQMIEGDFKSFRHGHYFSKTANDGTMMEDVLVFKTPYGILGQFMNALFLTSYLRNLLRKRNRIIKEYAESEKWKEFLW